MVLNIHDRRIRTKYEKRKRTLLKKLWEFYAFCNVEFHIVMVNGTEATVVSAGQHQLATEDLLNSGLNVERINIEDLERIYGRPTALPWRAHTGSEFDMEDAADDLNAEYSTDGTDLEDITEQDNIWDIVVPEPPS